MNQDDCTSALVLSGGGAFAAYEIGVMKALLQGEVPAVGDQPLSPAIVCGTSSGAFNGAMLVSRWQLDPRDAIAAMERIWLEDVSQKAACRSNGILRWRNNPLELFDPRCLLGDPLRFWRERIEDTVFFARQSYERTLRFVRSSEPYEQRFLELFDVSSLLTVSPFPHLLREAVSLTEIRRSPRRLSIAATNWDTGDVRLFSNQDMTDEVGALVIMASAAIPGFFPPVKVDGEAYVDGGLLMNTPLSPAIRAGGTLLFAVYLDPDVKNIPISQLETSVNTFQRTFSIATAANFNRDIEFARRINLELEQAGVAASPRRPASDPGAGGTARDRPYRPLTIHRFHPRDLLGSVLGFLTFERPALAALIERGYRDAVAHDCANADCVLPRP
jgi:predicted acylesterase/phospholipase RssA